MKKIIDCSNGEVIERELTAEEIAQQTIDEAEIQIIKSEAEAKTTQRQALLARLGITEEEARILLGGN